MKQNTRLTAFILILIGTIGLLVNEFFVNWGSAAVIIFAVLNIVGLIFLALSRQRD